MSDAIRDLTRREVLAGASALAAAAALAPLGALAEDAPEPYRRRRSSPGMAAVDRRGTLTPQRNVNRH